MLILHHLRKDKNGGNPLADIRGAGAITSTARSVLMFESSKDEAESADVDPGIAKNVVRVSHIKHNWTGKHPAITYRLCTYRHDSDNDDDLGTVYIEPFELPDCEDRIRQDAEIIMAAFDEIPDENRRVAAQAKSGWIAHALMPHLGIDELDKRARARVNQALLKLEGTGQIEQREWKDSARKLREIWCRVRH